MSKEQLLLDSLNKGTDMHSDLATTTYSIITGTDFKVGKVYEPVTFANGESLIPERCRDLHKRVVFGKIYKAGPARLYQVLAPHLNKFVGAEDRMNVCKSISKAFDKRVPKLTEFLNGKIELANTPRELNDELVYYLRANKLGRIRYFEEGVYGPAANYCIQATNADAIKIALIKIHDWLNETGYGRVALTVHDVRCV